MPSQAESLDFAGILDGYTESEQYQAPEADEKLATRLKEWFRHAQESRLSYERDWELYRLYLKGDQLVVRHRDTGEIVRLSADDSKRLRSVNNVVRPTARSLVGKLTRTIPTCTVLPATADFEEQHGARAATQFLTMLRRKERLDVKYLEVNNKLPWAGNAFMHVVWDHQAGRDIAYCEVCGFYDHDVELVETTCPSCEMQRQEEQALVEQQLAEQEMAEGQQFAENMEGISVDDEGEEGEMITAPPPGPPPEPQQLGPLPLDRDPPPLIGANEGDVKIHVRDPRDIFVDPGASAIDAASVICFREIISVAEARARFPTFAKVIHSESNLWTDRTAEIRYNSIDADGAVEYLDDHVYVYEFHEKQTPQYPKGRLICMINDFVVAETESPYWMFGRLPFFHFGFDKNDGEFWCEPFMAQAWHRQREINNIETQIREHVELLLKPKFFKAIGSRISSDELTAASAQVISYNAAAGRNYFEMPPPVPVDVFRRNSQLAADIRQQAAVTDQEVGMMASDPNGRAMAIVEAEADQQVGPILMRNNDEWREMHRCALMLVQSYYQSDRKFSSVGPDGMQTFSFDEISLAPGFDIQIEQEDGLSRNPAVRMTQALDLMNAGVFTDPMTGMPDIKSFMRHAKLRLPQAGYSIEATERAAASQVPYLIQEGQQHTPAPENDPMIFAEELLGWLRGPGRRADPMVLDQVRQIWQFYVAWAMQGAPPAPLGQPLGGGGGGGPGVGGPDQSAPGGSPNNPGRLGTDRPQGILPEAQQQVASADRAAESIARVTQNREG